MVTLTDTVPISKGLIQNFENKFKMLCVKNSLFLSHIFCHSDRKFLMKNSQLCLFWTGMGYFYTIRSESVSVVVVFLTLCNENKKKQNLFSYRCHIKNVLTDKNKTRWKIICSTTSASEHPAKEFTSCANTFKSLKFFCPFNTCTVLYLTL